MFVIVKALSVGYRLVCGYFLEALGMTKVLPYVLGPITLTGRYEMSRYSSVQGNVVQT